MSRKQCESCGAPLTSTLCAYCGSVYEKPKPKRRGYQQVTGYHNVAIGYEAGYYLEDPPDPEAPDYTWNGKRLAG